nr:hypothetical protein BgiMline_016483 [Biomphalaria glabrata]
MNKNKNGRESSALPAHDRGTTMAHGSGFDFTHVKVDGFPSARAIIISFCAQRWLEKYFGCLSPSQLPTSHFLTCSACM